MTARRVWVLERTKEKKPDSVPKTNNLIASHCQLRHNRRRTNCGDGGAVSFLLCDCKRMVWKRGVAGKETRRKIRLTGSCFFFVSYLNNLWKEEKVTHTSIKSSWIFHIFVWRCLVVCQPIENWREWIPLVCLPLGFAGFHRNECPTEKKPQPLCAICASWPYITVLYAFLP